MKIGLYAGVEYVKNLFTPRATPRTDLDADMDAKLLSLMASDAKYIRARNGVKYYYYFPLSADDISVAKMIMKRNGIKVRTHVSRYNYYPMQVLRALRSDIKSNPTRSGFIDAIKPMRTDINYAEYTERLNEIRAQMNQNIK